MESPKKVELLCRDCGHRTPGWREWFEAGQRCVSCSSVDSEVQYGLSQAQMSLLVAGGDETRRGIWRYHQALPVMDAANIVSAGEGDVAVERWSFLEQFAKTYYDIDCTVNVHRNDNNHATGTFKDLAGSVVASVLKEQKQSRFVVASTGNIGVAMSRYLAAAKIDLYVFIPQNSPKAQEAEIACFGQRVFRVQGDYAAAKALAREFAQKHDIPSAAGSFCPMRVEAKKTMMYEYMRQLDEAPSVYIQALSGGTGPLGIVKACKELKGAGLLKKSPRLLLVQSNECAPMAQAWASAEEQGFPLGWQDTYPTVEDPHTMISTLATGKPYAFPKLAPMVRESEGAIFDFPEREAPLVARWITQESAVRLGPAATIAIGGYLRALADGRIKNGDRVVINPGEGMRRAPDFAERLIDESHLVSRVEDCQLLDSQNRVSALRQRVAEISY